MTASPCPIGWRPHAIIRLREEIVGQFHTRRMPEQGQVRVEHAFRIAGGAGCVDNNRRIIHSGRNQLVIRRGCVDESSPFKHVVFMTLIDADQNCRRGKAFCYAD
jgi:hypothetical protein